MDPEILPVAAALILSYGAIVWRQGWRWVLGIGGGGGLLAGLLLLMASDLNGRTWLGGMVAAVSALAMGVGLVSGAIVQGIDALRPNGGSFAFRAGGLAVLLVAVAVFIAVAI